MHPWEACPTPQCPCVTSQPAKAGASLPSSWALPGAHWGTLPRAPRVGRRMELRAACLWKAPSTHLSTSVVLGSGWDCTGSRWDSPLPAAWGAPVISCQLPAALLTPAQLQPHDTGTRYKHINPGAFSQLHSCLLHCSQLGLCGPVNCTVVTPKHEEGLCLWTLVPSSGLGLQAQFPQVTL